MLNCRISLERSDAGGSRISHRNLTAKQTQLDGLIIPHPVVLRLSLSLSLSLSLPFHFPSISPFCRRLEEEFFAHGLIRFLGR